MESVKDLTDFERKLMTIIQHDSRKGESPSLEALEMRLGHSANDITETLKDLIKRKWLGISENQFVVLKTLF